MRKLALYYKQEIKGKFSLQKLNFLFVFQVNCPGCFLYGIPVVNELYHEFKDRISFLGLSTAFEDFEYNNAQNTRLLLENNTLVGETQKSLMQYGMQDHFITIDFPVAMDEVVSDDFDYKKGAAQICKTHFDSESMPIEHKSAIQKKVIEYLKGQETISKTFTLNQLQGTPTMIVFDSSYNILMHEFGHVTFEDLKAKLTTFFKVI